MHTHICYSTYSTYLFRIEWPTTPHPSIQSVCTVGAKSRLILRLWKTQDLMRIVVFRWAFRIIEKHNDRSVQRLYNYMSRTVPFVGWLVVFNIPFTTRSFRDGTPFTVPCEGREARFLHRTHRRTGDRFPMDTVLSMGCLNQPTNHPFQ